MKAKQYQLTSSTAVFQLL